MVCILYKKKRKKDKNKRERQKESVSAVNIIKNEQVEKRNVYKKKEWKREN